MVSVRNFYYLVSSVEYSSWFPRCVESANETWNNKKVNETNDNRKNVRKGIQINNNLQWGVSKQTPSPVRNEKKINKSTPNVEVKKPNTSKNVNQTTECGLSKPAAGSKNNARFSDPPINQRKLQRITKRREGTSKIGEHRYNILFYLFALVRRFLGRNAFAVVPGVPRIISGNVVATLGFIMFLNRLFNVYHLFRKKLKTIRSSVNVSIERFNSEL